MSQDELATMDGNKCILQLRGVRPFLSDKYDITKHPNFKYTADADDKNAFDIEAFLSARLKLKPNEVCDVYEVDTKALNFVPLLKGVILSIRRTCSTGHWRTKLRTSEHRSMYSYVRLSIDPMYSYVRLAS